MSIVLLKQRIKFLDNKSYNICRRQEILKNKLKILRCKELIESTLLQQYEWVFVDDYCRDKNYISLKAKTHYWKELEEASGESGYHWRTPIVKSELYVSGDDGDMYLHINQNVLKKWVKELGIVIDVVAIDADIDDIIEEISICKKNIEMLEELKNLMV